MNNHYTDLINYKSKRNQMSRKLLTDLNFDLAHKSLKTRRIVKQMKKVEWKHEKVITQSNSTESSDMELNLKDQSTQIDYTHSHDGLDEPTIVGQKRTYMEKEFFTDAPFTLKMTSTRKVKAEPTMAPINR